MAHLATYVGLLHRGESTLADAFRVIGEGHAAEADVRTMCEVLAGWSDDHMARLAPIAERYGEQDVGEPDRLHAAGTGAARLGPVGLLRDLQDLMLLASLVSSSWTVVGQAAQGCRDRELMEVAARCGAETQRQLAWLDTRIKAAAPQALLAAD